MDPTNRQDPNNLDGRRRAQFDNWAGDITLSNEVGEDALAGQGWFMREQFFLIIPIVGIAVIYCVWRRYFRARVRQDRKLRSRVTNLLWAMATQVKTKTIRRPK